MDTNTKVDTVEIIEEGTKNEVELASRFKRLISTLIDGLLITLISAVIIYFTGGFDNLTEAKEDSFLYTVLVGLGTLSIFFAINYKLLIEQGQSFGKKLLGIRIVNIDNSIASRKQLINRYCFIFIPGYVPLIGKVFNVIDMLLIFGKERRCLHDLTADTRVVKVQNNVEKT